MIPVPANIAEALAALSAAELRQDIAEGKRNLAYRLWEARRRGFDVYLSLEQPAGVLNDNEAREVVIQAIKKIQL